MGSEIVRPEDQDALPTSTAEVEFALVLSRMIDSVRNDPEHLRQTVYELARHKLQEQFASEDKGDVRQLSKALEVAIRGVETFVRNNGPNDTAFQSQQLALGSRTSAPSPARQEWPADQPVHPVVEIQDSDSREAGFWRGRFLGLRRFWSIAVVLAIGLTVVLVVQRGATVGWLRNKMNLAVAPPTSSPSRPPAVASSEATRGTKDDKPTESSPPVPTSYGIYAVSDDKFHELELLPGRAPDIRVPISLLITTPSRTTLPDGHIKFVVYRRDSATNAVDRADIRIIAKIERELSFDKAGKPVVSKPEDGWVIRNIAIPYRTAPRKDNPDMYEVRSEDPSFALAPGRYALVLKGLAYDFTVAGPVTDLRHCLERMVATNGQFYSECPKK